MNRGGPGGERRVAEPRADPAVERRINIVQGEREVSHDPGVVLTTILGSCVSACLRDPVAGVGGMNHFLLPGDASDAARDAVGTAALRYGVHAMELLVNELLRCGAVRSRLEAKLFGGARMMRGLSDVGALNAGFAERFLAAEGIALVGGSLRGDVGRRIQFWPVSGRARQMLLAGAQHDVFQGERQRPAPPVAAGAMELF